MKKVVIVILCLLSIMVKGQNLVPNPSFEDTLGCPYFIPDLEGKCKFWHSYRFTPDFFDACASSGTGYNNIYGYQQPRTGYAYTGIAMYWNTFPYSKEQIGVQLISPMVIGVKYFVTFYVSLAYNAIQENIAVSKIGARFTTYTYHDSTGQIPFNNDAQVYTNSIITDSINWVKISGSFIADSAYQYLSIGAFFDNAHTDTIQLPYQIVPQISYYYLDDVCVSTDSLTCNGNGDGINENTLPKPISLFPSPNCGTFTLQYNLSAAGSLRITDLLGREVYAYNLLNRSGQETVTLLLGQGIYFWQVLQEQSVYANGKLVIIK